MGNPSTKESDMHEVASLYSIQKDPFRLNVLENKKHLNIIQEQIMLRDTHKEHWRLWVLVWHMLQCHNILDLER